MATYVNDLRLKEIATGDESGTWGTSTNTNLELIGEALGYGTQEVFSSDADATTTIADGASDPARAMYFKITSGVSLTATRTCTIAPNTVSRVMFIENATTGSQSIAISQGSGANVTIATGKTAVVYLDGAGATAAVVDAMAGVDPGVTDTLAEVLVAGNTSGGTNIELTTTDKVQFRDTAIYINSSADGQLDIVADTEIQIATTTVDLNGILDVSGNTTLGADVTFTGASYNAVWDSSDSALEFADNAKAVFGAGSDLQIYHDGSSSYIVNTQGSLVISDSSSGAGDMTLQTNGSELSLFDSAGSKYMLRALTGGQVDLYHNGSTKLSTTATGVDVTGTLTTTGNVGIGTASPATKLHVADASDSNAQIRINGSTSTVYSRLYSDNNGVLAISTDVGNQVAGSYMMFEVKGTERMRIDASGNVGIGTSSPQTSLSIETSGTQDVVSPVVTGQTAGVTYGGLYTVRDGAGDQRGLVFQTFKANEGLGERLRITSSGNVGIGTSPSSGLHLQGADNVSSTLTLTNTAPSPDNTWSFTPQYNSGDLTIADDGTERMRIDADGNLLVGTTSAFGTTGTTINQAGLIYSSADGDRSGQFDRTGVSDGEIVRFTKAGTTVGSIGTDSGGNLQTVSSTGNYRFGDSDTTRWSVDVTRMYPMLDATYDIGLSSNRVRDLYLSGSAKLVADSAASAEIQLKQTGAGGRDYRISSTGSGYGSAGALVFYDATASSERARFDASGNLLVGKSSSSTSGAGTFIETTSIGHARINLTSENTTATVVSFYYDNGTTATQVGTIVTSTTATTYNTSSDQRLKENIVDAPSASDDIDAIQVRSFDWKSDGSHQKYGMVAQELQTVAPEAVSGDADSEEMMGVDYSKLVPMMLKEIQSLRARVSELESK